MKTVVQINLRNHWLLLFFLTQARRMERWTRAMNHFHRQENMMLLSWLFKVSKLNEEKKEELVYFREIRKAPFFLIVAIIIICVIMLISLTISFFTGSELVGLIGFILSLLILLIGVFIEIFIILMIRNKEIPELNDELINNSNISIPMNSITFNSNFF